MKFFLFLIYRDPIEWSPNLSVDYIHQNEQIEQFRSLKLSHNFFFTVAQFSKCRTKSILNAQLSHTQKCIDKSLYIMMHNNESKMYERAGELYLLIHHHKRFREGTAQRTPPALARKNVFNN